MVGTALHFFVGKHTLKPTYAEAHTNLGLALAQKGLLDEAVAAHQRAIALQPDYAQAHYNLGLALRQKGQFGEALAALRRGHELGVKSPGWRYPSAQWVREAERLVELDGKLPAVLRGEAEPADAEEQAALADLCRQHKRLYAGSARLYREALAAKPDLAPTHRYNAARAAALAGCGQGEDAANSPLKKSFGD